MKKLYPYTNVVLLRDGESRILFANNTNVMSIENDIIDPVLKKVELERYLLEDNDVINIIANTFTNFPNNIPNGVKGYLTIHGGYERGITTISKESGYIKSALDNTVEDLKYIGRNSKEKTKWDVVSINERLSTVFSKLTSLCVKIKDTIILQKDVDELNS